jgi:hypothetical protein
MNRGTRGKKRQNEVFEDAIGQIENHYCPGINEGNPQEMPYLRALHQDRKCERFDRFLAFFLSRYFAKLAK